MRIATRTFVMTFILFMTTRLSGAVEVNIEINGNYKGRTYEGIGGVSAGASSRLLIDYPEPYRSDVLDYLFKPKFGAGFQHLKVEMGGGENSTCGSEPSHAITKEELKNPKSRGYEFWLMKEARKRNPDIILDYLPWSFPHWTTNNNVKGRPFTEDSADYFVAFLDVARKQWDMEIDWVAAAMNESGTDREWVKLLRKRMDAAGYEHVKIQTPDHNGGFWKIFNEFEWDPEYEKVVDAVGYHYLNGYGVGQQVDIEKPERRAPEKVKATGKPLWASEDWSYGGENWKHASWILQSFNQLYCRDRVTKYQMWSPFDSIYNCINYKNVGTLGADTPWSGYYAIWPAVWVTAHYGQFTEPGWRYLNEACGQFTTNTWLGSYVTIRDTQSDNWSMIISTDEPVTLNGTITGGLSAKRINVWHSNEKEQFIQKESVPVKKGKFTVQLEEKSFYSLTTTTGQQKGKPPHPIPENTPFPFPYSEDFESYKVGDTPKYFSDQKGTFEVAEVNGNKCLAQITPQTGKIWAKRDWETTWTIVGGVEWKSFTCKVDVKIAGGDVEIGGGHSRRAPEYRFIVNEHGEWKVITIKVDKTKESWRDITQLASGTIQNFDKTRWHTLQITVSQKRIESFIDGVSVVAVNAELKTVGPIHLGTSYHNNLFDNIKVEPANK
ncbi:hypothetical protein ACFLS1_10450 [Verrucomicrobiota bacterium]